MRALVHELLRWWIRQLVVGLGLALEVLHNRRIAGFERAQSRLRNELGLDPNTPIRGFDEVQREALSSSARRIASNVLWAATSGSTAEPKRVAYTPSRVRAVKWVYMDSFARAYAKLRIQRPSLYVFSALKRDDSLTALMLDEPGLPPYLSSLQAPYRVHNHPEVQALAERYGAVAARMFVIAVSNPGVVYATNPSTLSTFFDQLQTDFRGSTALIRALVDTPAAVPAIVHRLRRRLDARGAEERLRLIAASPSPLAVEQWWPGLEAYVTWDGGDLAPFLRRLDRHLDPARYRRIPMYSMSTETVETVSHYGTDEVGFLPLATGVYYELLPEALSEEPGNLISPRAARVGERYLLVVSDRHGLRRYQTEDIFEVRKLVLGLPDLRFLRRRGLAFSFTGEKLTGEQARLAFQRARQEQDLDETLFLSLLPMDPKDAPSPRYELAIVGAASELNGPLLATSCDRALQEINSEYAAKRDSGRLGPIRARLFDVEAFAELVGGERHRGSWEAQLKFLPLYPRCFES